LLANSGTGYTYQWYRNNSLLPGETSLAYLATTAGNYTVDVSNAEGCTKRSGKRKVVSSGCRLADAGSVDYLSIFPNPSSGTFQFVWREAQLKDENILVQVRNSKGQQVYQEMISASDGMAAGSISLTLASGTYLIRLVQSDGINTQEIIVVQNE
jgi:hypothetical protein